MALKKSLLYTLKWKGGGERIYDGGISDGRISDGRISDGIIYGGMISDGMIYGGMIYDGRISDGMICLRSEPARKHTIAKNGGQGSPTVDLVDPHHPQFKRKYCESN